MPKAARMGDSCAGHGCFPSTPITAGSGDVSINGRPAARKGDTVLLHACPCPNMPHGVDSDSAATKAAAERLLFNNDNILRAEAAQYVYRVDEFKRGHISELPEPPLGLGVVDTSQILKLKKAVFCDKKSGFGAELFKSSINNETMLTFRGTNNGVTGIQDWITNGKQGMGMESVQYNQAMKLAKKIDDSIDDFTMVGHSLGGGLAASAVGVTGKNGYTFNAAGLHPNTVDREKGLPMAEIEKLIQTQAVNGEILTGLQDLRAIALPMLLGGIGSLGGSTGRGVGVLASRALLAKGAIPKALGTMQRLESIDGGHPITRHGMEQVIVGIEAQKQADIKTLTDK